MKVRFVEQSSGVVLWSEERASVYSGRYNSPPYVQLNSKRLATWWISRIDDTDPGGLVLAYVEPSNERATRRMLRRRDRLHQAKVSP